MRQFKKIYALKAFDASSGATFSAILGAYQAIIDPNDSGNGNYKGNYGYDMDAQSDLINIAIIVIYGVAIFIVLVADMVVRCGKGCPESKSGSTQVDPADPPNGRIDKLLEQVGKVMTEQEALLKIMKEQQQLWQRS